MSKTRKMAKPQTAVCPGCGESKTFTHEVAPTSSTTESKGPWSHVCQNCGTGFEFGGPPSFHDRRQDAMSMTPTRVVRASAIDTPENLRELVRRDERRRGK